VRRRPRARILAEISGGGQERGFRSGTLPVPLTVALGEAAAVAQVEMTGEGKRLAELRARMVARLREKLGAVTLNGSMDRRVPGNLNIGFAGVDAEALMAELPELAISTGSACTSASVEPSYVLKALDLSDAEAGSAVRIGFGRFTTLGEVDAAADMIVKAVKNQRSGNSVRAAE
jgi:cysteine desulfurase